MNATANLEGSGTQLLVHGGVGDRPRLLHAGPTLPGATAQDFAGLSERQHAPGGPQLPVAPSLLNPLGTGYPGPPGLLLHRDGCSWAVDLRLVEYIEPSASLTVVTRDDNAGVTVRHDFAIDASTGVLSLSASLANSGDTALDLQWLSAVCLPLDPRFDRIMAFGGKWAGEFQIEEWQPVRGAFLRENRSGRTSHTSFPGLYCGTSATSETHGPAAAFHLGWSGNHRLRIDRLPDDTLALQAGELLLPGEMRLEPGESYSTPTLYACWAEDGHGEATRRLHAFVADQVGRSVPRPVHFNTWEAVYFDHSPDRLFALADQAAETGAERFVLDDGWFGARRSDRAGLGDWFVSEDVYPDGLGPLADHVRSLGMEFGLWFEPEMVNPDSDLFREHPDWVLGVERVDPIASRHQLPLDLTRSEVSDYLFERIDHLVRELSIAYIKWDMNRDIQHPGNAGGRPAVHRQTRAVYALIDRLCAAHPELEIESCSSGGARADYGILQRTHRIWTSDNNDARQRHAIMRGAAYFLPLRVLGNHVGPKRCHITGRRFDMHFRAGTAVFGHMGMELDLATESVSDRGILKAAIALHKRHRALIHGGDYHRLETPAQLAAIGVVSRDRGEALFQTAVIDQHPSPHPPRLRFVGLDLQRRYKVACVWPTFLVGEPASFAGSALMQYGLQLPQTYPDTCLIHHLEAEE
ncbi:alpha-galactosidase [Erythrobacter sp. JK5]|uniref:alpha-galactosidase n=1 Tax=Erythrobacter sp. JK5 TaxID=2829500 RepID=UPI0020124D82|nr:alpha-galactosidase [Erythrobacter sp. JK5]